MSEGIDATLQAAMEASANEDFPQALKLADEVLAVRATSVDALLLRAIALSSLGRQAEATSAFRQALSLNPTSARIAYNYALHLSRMGDTRGAREFAERALAEDPTYASATDLLASLPPVAQPDPAPVAEEQSRPPASVRAGYQHQVRTVPFIQNLGSFWTTLGWLLTLGGAVNAVAMGALFFRALDIAMRPDANSLEVQRALEANPAFNLVSILHSVLMVLTLLWVAFDVADRRISFAWLVPAAISAMCCMNWAFLPLYMLLIRKNAT